MVSTPASARSDCSSAKSAGPGRPKDMGKRAAILEAAKVLFSHEGYAGTSMDQIAAEAGVSKLTVYSHFGDKEALFSAAVQARCQEVLPDTLFEVERKGPLREQLLAIGTGYLTLVTTDEAIATHRMMVMPGNADDPLRRLFWEAGPQRTHAAMAEFLRARAAAGELEMADIHRASGQFFALLKGERYNHMLCGLADPPSPAELDAHVQASVDMFLAAYVPR